MPSPVRSLLDAVGGVLADTLRLGEGPASAVTHLLSIAGVLVLVWLAYRLLVRLIHRLLQPLETGTGDLARMQRARTLGPLLVSVVRYALAFVAVVVVFQELGIDVRAFVVSAGVVGIAIGFGAQSLIRDVIAGLFILFENLIAVGDVIEVGAHAGVVEQVGFRVTKIRKFSGELRIVPNGELTAFGHHSAGWARAVVEVGIAYDEDVTRALQVLDDVGRAIRAAHPGAVLEPMAAEGIVRFGPSEVVLRLCGRVTALERQPIEYEIRQRVREALIATGVRLPVAETRVRLAPDPGRDPDRKESAA